MLEVCKHGVWIGPPSCYDYFCNFCESSAEAPTLNEKMAELAELRSKLTQHQKFVVDKFIDNTIKYGSVVGAEVASWYRLVGDNLKSHIKECVREIEEIQKYTDQADDRTWIDARYSHWWSEALKVKGENVSAVNELT